MKKALITLSKNDRKMFIHLIILMVFIVVSLVTMNPILKGKVLSQSDMTQVSGMSQELRKYHEETGEYSQWTNSMFSGMPSFHVGPSGTKDTVFTVLGKIFRFGLNSSNPLAIFFIYLLCFYVLLLTLRSLFTWLS